MRDNFLRQVFPRLKAFKITPEQLKKFQTYGRYDDVIILNRNSAKTMSHLLSANDKIFGFRRRIAPEPKNPTRMTKVTQLQRAMRYLVQLDLEPTWKCETLF